VWSGATLASGSKSWLGLLALLGSSGAEEEPFLNIDQCL
jgi:hypothetical protein